MSKITNDGLTRSSTGCFIAVPNNHMATMWRQRDNISVGIHLDTSISYCKSTVVAKTALLQTSMLGVG